jgi:carotenoid cleavage dioxygenase-like enzyme
MIKRSVLRRGTGNSLQHVRDALCEQRHGTFLKSDTKYLVHETLHDRDRRRQDSCIEIATILTIHDVQICKHIPVLVHTPWFFDDLYSWYDTRFHHISNRPGQVANHCSQALPSRHCCQNEEA